MSGIGGDGDGDGDGDGGGGAGAGPVGPAFTVSVGRDQRDVARVRRWAFNMLQLVGSVLGDNPQDVAWGPNWAVVLTRQSDGAFRVLRTFGREGSDHAAAAEFADKVAVAVDELGIDRVAEDQGVTRSFIDHGAGR